MGETEDETKDHRTKISHGIFSVLESRWLDQTRGRKLCVLSIDGGGMRGVMACQCLVHLQNMLRVKSGNPQAHISDYFDIAAGSNMGGVIVATLFTKAENGKPLFPSPQQSLDFIAEKGKEMFELHRGSYLSKRLKKKKFCKYSTKRLAAVLKTLFSTQAGKPFTLKETVKPVLIPCYDMLSASPFVFSRAGAQRSQNYNFNMWEVCRATLSSPGLYEAERFTSVDGKTECVGIDGGLVMNNPTAAAITHVTNNKSEFPSVKGVDDLLVLSVGGGQFASKHNYEKMKSWKSVLRWAKPVMEIVMTEVSDIVDHAVSLAFSHNPHNYLRIQATKVPEGVSEGVWGEIDDPSEANVKNLVRLAENMMKEKSMEYLPFGWKNPLPQSNAERLAWFAEQLVLEQKCRASTTAGEL